MHQLYIPLFVGIKARNVERVFGMNVFLYIMIFIAGTVFGSFFSLAVYRIPRKENIVYVQSHCTTCNHKLYFWDLIPILSYLFLRGRCRYCHDKIRCRYILLEIFSGLVFVLVANSMHIHIFSSIMDFMMLFCVYLWIAGVFIVGGIDKEKYLIPDVLCLYLCLISCFHLILLGLIKCSVIDNMVGFLAIPAVLALINLVYRMDQTKEEPIGWGDIKYFSVIGLFMGFGAQLLVFPLSLFIAGIGKVVHKYQKIPWGFYLSIASVVVLIVEHWIPETMNLISIGK